MLIKGNYAATLLFYWISLKGAQLLEKKKFKVGEVYRKSSEFLLSLFSNASLSKSWGQRGEKLPAIISMKQDFEVGTT